MTDGETTWSYKYNADGLRTEKANGTATYKYVYSGSTLVQMSVGENVLSFGYDGSTPVTVTYNGTTYYYVTNLQGDIVAILDGSGAVVVSYEYDAWGNILSTTGTLADTLGQINPLRYRGYVYDQETGLYYLQSRYYDAKVGRFLNADVYASTDQGVLGHNMFAYCNNNPVNYFDPTGHLGRWLLAGIKGVLLKVSRELYTRINAENITQKLNHAMINNAEELHAYRKMYGWPAAILYFIDKVKPGGDWDFKAQEEWGLDPDKVYLYNGKKLAYDDIGNIHYGYVGRVLFTEDILLDAGGYVQIFTKTSSWSYWNSNWDDPRDQKAIKFGFKLWREGFA